MWRALPVSFVLYALMSSGAAVLAQSAVEGEESPELAALREMEQEVFGGQPLVVLPDASSRVRTSDGAPGVTSDVPNVPEAASSPPSRDLSWLRGLTLPDIPVRWDDRVIRYLEFFRDDPRGQRHIRSWLRRVDRYGPTIRETLRAQGLPRDLIFVAMVESGFSPTARSHAGAAGMWQFVRRTGEELDLPVNHWVDARLDPARSTVAAGRYLSMLHERFGTWELAFAAYNMGYGALLRSIRKYNTNDYWELAHLEAGLPYETNLYVAKIVACAIIAHNRERFGLGDVEMEPVLRWDTVHVPGGVGLRALARAAGSNLETMRRLNPALRRSRTPPGASGWDIHIPHGSADRFAERWARSRPGHPAPRPRIVRFGETLSDIARLTGATERGLRELNEIERDQRLGVGMRLLVPVTRGRARPVHDEEPVIAVPAGPRAIPGRRRVFYRVVRGDRARDIARFFAVAPEALRQWNGVDPDAELQSGMFLQLFVPSSVDLTRALVMTPDDVRVLVVGSEEFFAYHEAQEGRVRFRYTVQSGDTLSEIASRFDTRSSSLARINQISQRSTIFPGDELIVYTEPSRVPRELRSEPEPEPVPVATPEPEPEADREDGDEEEAEVAASDDAEAPTPAPSRPPP